MKSPLRLEVRGFELTAQVDALVHANVEKFERRFGRITSGQVAIAAPGAHHRMGEPYAVSIRLLLPGRKEVSVGRVSRNNDRRQGDLTFAINDAFRRAMRQLQDSAKKLQGEVKTSRAASRNKVKAS